MLLDTSGLLCFFDANDARHNEADIYFRAAIMRLTHSYVLSEFVTLAHVRGLSRSDATAFVTTLLEHPRVEVVWVGESLHRQAMALLDARPDKAYSLCDAVSFVLMKERGILEALTTDHHFEQEGFRRLFA